MRFSLDWCSPWACELLCGLAHKENVLVDKIIFLIKNGTPQIILLVQLTTVQIDLK
jgi:hypothetical protein